MSDSPDTPSVEALAPQLSDQLASGGPVWLRVGRLFPGDDTRVLDDAHLVVDSQSIRHAGTEAPPAELLRPGQTSPDHELPGLTALPGLTDAHTHLFLEGGETNIEARSAYLKSPAEEQLASATSRLERLVRLGVTAVREAGDKSNIGLDLQARYRSDARGIMPYVDAPGAAINHQKRYGSFMSRPTEEFDSPAATVADRVDAGAHRIKLIATGIINFAKGAVTAKPQMPAEELSAFVAAAREHGQQTMVHCSGNDGVANCLAARVDTVEHCYFNEHDQLARIRDLDMVWVPTLAPVQFQFDRPECVGWSDEVCDHLRRIVAGHMESLAHAIEIGVRVVAGSDAGSHGVAHGWGFLRELELMQQSGLSAATVLHTATGAGELRMGYAERFGVLAPGAKSRLILTAHDVLTDVAALRRDKVVIFDQHALAGTEAPDTPGL
jgi:imidazolonepropionase-like amidohydrolase